MKEGIAEFNILNVIWYRHRCLVPHRATKVVLYEKIAEMRHMLGISYTDYPIDIYQILDRLSDVLRVEREPLPKSVHGMIIPNPAPEKTVLVLNQAADSPFAAAHELVHYFAHGTAEAHGKMPRTLLEWQANEGAAELLLPYRLFVPEYCNIVSKATKTAESDVVGILAERYSLSRSVVTKRVAGLHQEIIKFLTGVPIEDIRPVSLRRLESGGV